MEYSTYLWAATCMSTTTSVSASDKRRFVVLSPRRLKDVCIWMIRFLPLDGISSNDWSVRLFRITPNSDLALAVVGWRVAYDEVLKGGGPWWGW